MGARERGSGTAVFGVTHITERSPGAQLQSAICMPREYVPSRR